MALYNVTQEKVASVAYTTPVTVRELSKHLLKAVTGKSHFNVEVSFYRVPKGESEPRFIASRAWLNIPFENFIEKLTFINRLGGGR